MDSRGVVGRLGEAVRACDLSRDLALVTSRAEADWAPSLLLP